MSVLPPYSGPETACPKCAATHADTEWMPPHSSLSPYGQIMQAARQADGPYGQGWLLRRCTRCRYPWAEACRDSNITLPAQRAAL